MSLFDRIERREAIVAVIGLGYMGLPQATAFADAGFRVIGIDNDKQRVESLNAGHSYISDVPSERLSSLLAPNQTPSTTHLGRAPGSFSATTDYNALFEADAALICVPTPLSKTKDPDLSHIVSAVDEIAPRLHPEMLVVLESTTYPGTTDEIILPRLARAQAERPPMEVGEDFFLAFSPERTDPGRTDWTLTTVPKVIGGMTPRCLETAHALYQCAVKEVVPVSSPKVGEMVKLLENTFRAVNIALVNEMAIMCGHLGIDVWEVVDAAKTKPFGFMPFYPGPGLGGHCIPVDPHYLAWKLKTLNYSVRFIQLAAEINFGMPSYVLNKVADALNENGKPLKGSRVLILGVAYKADVGDLRESPALDLIHFLREKGALVTYHDPLVPRVDVDGLAMDAVALDKATLDEVDCVVITTAPSGFDWQWLVDNSRLIMDTRNATAGTVAHQGRVVKL